MVLRFTVSAKRLQNYSRATAIFSIIQSDLFYSQEESMKCKNCQAEVPEYFTNCPNCKESMIADSGTTQPTSPKQFTQERSSPGQPSPQQYSSHSVEKADESSGNRKNNNRMAIYGLIGVGGLILISVIIIIVVTSSTRNANGAESNQPIPGNTIENNLSDSPAPNEENRADHADSPLVNNEDSPLVNNEDTTRPHDNAETPEPPSPEPLPLPGEQSILLDKSTYAPGESVQIKVTGVTQEMLDAWGWVGAYHAGDSNDAYGRLGLWEYLTSTGTVTFDFTLPSDTGSFEFRLFNDSGHSDEAFVLSVPFTIGS